MRLSVASEPRRAVDVVAMFAGQANRQGPIRADAATAAALLVAKGLPVAEVPRVLSRSTPHCC